MARRIWADTWIYPTLQDVAAALAPLLNIPQNAELWPDTKDMPILREDAMDAAAIAQTNASTISSHITAGFTPESAVRAVIARDESLLVHTGLVSVQLQPPGAELPGYGQPKLPATNGKAPAVTKSETP